MFNRRNLVGETGKLVGKLRCVGLQPPAVPLPLVAVGQGGENGLELVEFKIGPGGGGFIEVRRQADAVPGVEDRVLRFKDTKILSGQHTGQEDESGAVVAQVDPPCFALALPRFGDKTLVERFETKKGTFFPFEHRNLFRNNVLPDWSRSDADLDKLPDGGDGFCLIVQGFGDGGDTGRSRGNSGGNEFSRGDEESG